MEFVIKIVLYAFRNIYTCGMRKCWTKKTPAYRLGIRLPVRLRTQLLTDTALSSSVRFVTLPTEILAVKCKYAELRSRYSSPLPVIVNSKRPDSTMLDMR